MVEISVEELGRGVGCVGLWTAARAAQQAATWAPCVLGLRMERPPNSACLQACHLSLVVTVVAVVTESAFGRVAQRILVLVAIWAGAQTRRSKSGAQAALQQSESHVTGGRVDA